LAFLGVGTGAEPGRSCACTLLPLLLLLLLLLLLFDYCMKADVIVFACALHGLLRNATPLGPSSV